MSRLNIANSIQCLTASRVSKSLGLPVFETRPLFFFTDNKAAEVLTEFESHTKIFLMTTRDISSDFWGNQKPLF